MMTTLIADTTKEPYDSHGRVDTEAVAKRLGVKMAVLAHALGMKPDTLRKNPVRESAQPIAQRLVAVIAELTRLFDGDEKSALIWIRKPNPDLEGASPLQVISEGDLDVVEGIVEAIASGQPS